MYASREVVTAGSCVHKCVRMATPPSGGGLPPDLRGNNRLPLPSPSGRLPPQPVRDTTMGTERADEPNDLQNMTEHRVSTHERATHMTSSYNIPGDAGRKQTVASGEEIDPHASPRVFYGKVRVCWCTGGVHASLGWRGSDIRTHHCSAHVTAM